MDWLVVDKVFGHTSPQLTALTLAETFSHLLKIFEIWSIHSEKIIKFLKVLLCNLTSAMIYCNSMFQARSRGSRVRRLADVITRRSSTVQPSIQTQIKIFTNQWYWTDAVDRVSSRCAWKYQLDPQNERLTWKLPLPWEIDRCCPNIQTGLISDELLRPYRW